MGVATSNIAVEITHTHSTKQISCQNQYIVGLGNINMVLQMYQNGALDS